MTAVVNFAFEEHLVRVIDIAGEPWFVGNDVCRALGLSNPRKAIGDLDEDEKGVTIGDTPGGAQSLNVVSEPGVYRLVFRSRKPETERFKRWLAHEVIPAIRRTGRFGEDPAPVAPQTERDAPLAARVEAVRLAERLFGRARARLVWRDLALPDVPEAEPVEDDAAERLLAALFAMSAGGRTLEDALRGDDEAALLACGVRPADGGFWLASGHAAPRAALAAFPRWPRLLARLPGARTRIMRFGGLVSRAVFVDCA